MGLPYVICVSCANVTDRNGTLEIIKCNLNNLSGIDKFLVDGGYIGENFANAVMQFQNAKVKAVKRNELHNFDILPKCYIVEHSFEWLKKYCIL